MAATRQKKVSASASASELATLYPAARTFPIAGRNVTIEPLSMRQAGRVFDLGLPLWLGLGDGEDPMALLDERPTEANALIVAATGLDADWVASLPAVDRGDIVAAWLEVNGSFFVRRLVSQRLRVAKAMHAVGTGPT